MTGAAYPVHFVYDDTKEADAALARSLMRDLGQAAPSDAFAIVSIGGDGTLLRALNKGAGRITLGLTANANSVGFWTNRLEDPSAQNVMDLLENGDAYPISPVGATITFADGTQTVRHGFNDVIVRPAQNQMSALLRHSLELPVTDISIQSMLVKLHIAHAQQSLGSRRVMGSGLIFSTSYGSTAINHAYGGPALDIRNDAIILTGMGVTDPKKGFNAIVCDADTSFEVEVISPDKRPIMVGYDSFGLFENENGSPIVRLALALDHATQTRLVLQDSPGIRAFAALDLVRS